MRLIRTRDRFVSEIAGALSTRFSSACVEDVMDRLLSRGIVNDCRLITQLVEANVGRKAISAQLLREKCEARGAAPEALELIDPSFVPSLTSLLARYQPIQENRQKAGRYLASKGFEGDEIDSALDAYFGPVSISEE